MKGSEWLDEFTRRATVRAPEIECSRSEPGSLSLAAGARSVILHDRGDAIMLARASAGGTSIASRLTAGVKYLDAVPFGLDVTTIDAALNAALDHLTSDQATP
jgi:hypothetical protein